MHDVQFSGQVFNWNFLKKSVLGKFNNDMTPQMLLDGPTFLLPARFSYNRRNGGIFQRNSAFLADCRPYWQWLMGIYAVETHAHARKWLLNCCPLQ